MKKAYTAWDAKIGKEKSTVVFAETVVEAKGLAMRSEACEDSDFMDIRVRRFQEMDGKDRGRDEIDWYDQEDRKALVALGWACYDTNWECDTCTEKPNCRHWEEDEE
jgi:hypothetical protein